MDFIPRIAWYTFRTKNGYKQWLLIQNSLTTYIYIFMIGFWGQRFKVCLHRARCFHQRSSLRCDAGDCIMTQGFVLQRRVWPDVDPCVSDTTLHRNATPCVGETFSADSPRVNRALGHLSNKRLTRSNSVSAENIYPGLPTLVCLPVEHELRHILKLEAQHKQLIHKTTDPGVPW